MHYLNRSGQKLLRCSARLKIGTDPLHFVLSVVISFETGIIDSQKKLEQHPNRIRLTMYWTPFPREGKTLRRDILIFY